MAMNDCAQCANPNLKGVHTCEQAPRRDAAKGWVCPICHAGVAPSCVRCPCSNRNTPERPVEKALREAYEGNFLSSMAQVQYTDGLGQVGIMK